VCDSGCLMRAETERGRARKLVRGPIAMRPVTLGAF